MAAKKNNLAQYYFHEGTNFASYNYLGAHFDEKKNVYTFRTWAPNADEVFLAADFNEWKKTHPLKRESEAGVWSIELPCECF